MSNTLRFINTLFDKDERTCFSSTPYGIEVNFDWYPEDVFFSINPLHSSRADQNCTALRSILVECDSTPLEEQIELVTSRIPVTSIVYSGGKSYHFIISLEEPCKDRADYDELVRRIYALIPEADRTAKNPSRFSRLPGSVRPETGKEQTLEFLGSRISRAKIESVLPAPKPPPTRSEPQPGFYHPLVVEAIHNPDGVMDKLGMDSRNAFFYWLGQRLKETTNDSTRRREIVETVYTNLRHNENFSLQEALNAGRCR